MMEYGLSYTLPAAGRKSGAGVHLIEGAFDYCRIAKINLIYLEGVPTSVSDPLYRFKRSLSNRSSKYHVFPVIYDEKKYRRLTKNKSSSNLLSYREN